MEQPLDRTTSRELWGSGIFHDIEEEVIRARYLHPGCSHLMVALMEEVGEACKEFLDKGSQERKRAELVQVCCVAIRLILEGDGDFSSYGP